MEGGRFKPMQDKLRAEVEAFKQLQQDIAVNHQARQQFTQQRSENEMVLQYLVWHNAFCKELHLLDGEDSVYKLIGPVLIKQDLVEAKSNVSKRLEYIHNELSRIDSQLKGYEEKQARKQQQILKAQQELQKLQQPATTTSAVNTQQSVFVQ